MVRAMANGKKLTRKSANQPVRRAPDSLAMTDSELLSDLQQLIRQAREQVARAVNSALLLLYWEIGHRIRTEVLRNNRAGYGEEIVSTLSKELVAEFGEGFAEKNLRRMVQLAAHYSDQAIVVTLSRQLGWSHFLALLPLKDPLQRDFYAEMCRVERWSVRTLREKIQGMLYERTALSRKPRELAKQELHALRDEDLLSPDLVFRDPYLLDFLGLKDTYSEADLEAAIIREIERFILELGAGFCFVARQKRITIDGEDFHLDLLFYHRRLRRLVAVDLKLGKFQAADKGQMELYLRWLERNETEPGEQAPLGLILCADKGDEQVELLQLDKSGIRVATYLTELPSRRLLEQRLHEAVKTARASLSARQSKPS
jgi:predicted nuclease of restriction endonuclease-like (RecB) superfamily